MPGRNFASPADFNHQFTGWLATANQRVVRTTQAKPVDRLETDRAAMLLLPPVPPVLGWRKQVRLGRDYYVRVASNDYSVDPTWIGRMVDTHADLEQVQVRLDGRLIAEHPRVWARGLTMTDTAHVDTAKRLRQEFQQPSHPCSCRWAGQGPGRLRQSVRADRGGGLVMATRTTDAAKQLTYLAGALKAPRILDVAGRLADQARDAGWSFEDYLAAVLEREVSARNASGAELRMRAAGFGAPQNVGGLRLRRSASRPEPGRLAGLRRVPHRSPQRRPAWPARHREDPFGDRSRRDRLPPRPPGPVRHRN